MPPSSLYRTSDPKAFPFQRKVERLVQSPPILKLAGNAFPTSSTTSTPDFLNPLVGIVDSSNFTAPGLTSNRELNLVHKNVVRQILREHLRNPDLERS